MSWRAEKGKTAVLNKPSIIRHSSCVWVREGEREWMCRQVCYYLSF